MTQEITITVETIARGFKTTVAPVSGKPQEIYCAKSYEIPQAVKNALAAMFPKSK